MAILPEQQRVIWRAVADRMLSNGPVRFTKNDLKAAAVVIDTQLINGATGINNALNSDAPIFGANATNQEKLLMIAMVALSRAGLL